MLALGCARFGAQVPPCRLMGNHQHLVVYVPKGGLSQAMQHLNGVPWKACPPYPLTTRAAWPAAWRACASKAITHRYLPTFAGSPSNCCNCTRPMKPYSAKPSMP